ncbi:cytosine permease [Christensenellaceae bacterium OttesenSCG-928-M15]|nr:cytosine permease [Christensenellaceae bacterium OttesenSCG-928-M15]
MESNTQQQSKGSVETRTLSRVRPEERQSTASIAFIWIGGVISIPMLMVGAILGTGLSLGMVVIVTLVAFAVQVFLMTLNGIQASDTGYPLAILLGKTFGEVGSRYLTSALVGLMQIGWFAIQTAVCGSAFSSLLTTLGLPIPVWISSILWGVIMLVTAVYGFGWMKILNYLSVPLLVIACTIATIMAGNEYGFAAIASYQPENSMGFIPALAIMIGVFASGTITVCDLTRYAKSRKATTLSSIFGIVPAALMMTTMGAIMGIAANTGDVTEVFVKLGMPVLGVVALVLATWTTNTTNAYTAGISLTRLFNLPDNKRPMITAIAGAVGILLATLGIANNFDVVMNILATLIPPIAGIMVADYWIIGKGKKENWGIIKGVNYIGVISWAFGSLIGFIVPIFSPSFNSIVVGMITYLVLYALVGKKLPKAVDPEA